MKGDGDYDEGDIRLRKKFLLFPMKLGNEKRWMETVYMVQEYESSYVNYDDWESSKWFTCESYGFITPEEYPNVIKSMKNDFPNCLRLYSKEEKI